MGDEQEVNPYIPKYISKAPWYIADPDAKEAPLAHQRRKERTDLARFRDSVKKGVAAEAATRFRKGACENCGAVTHKRRDCTERPRARGAAATGRDIAPDEFIAQPQYDFEGKRDHWAAYDESEHLRLLREHEAIEAERVRLREAETLRRLQNGEKIESDDEDEDEIANPKTKSIVQSLRLRESLPKYLLDLQREREGLRNGTLAQDGANKHFVRATTASGDQVDHARMQVFMFEKMRSGEAPITMEAAPTASMMLRKELEERRKKILEEKKRTLAERYGVHLEAGGSTVPAELQPVQSEDYVEYGRDGKQLRGLEKAVTKSRYVEDEFPLNHSSVWGSFWRRGVWGYACCHQTVRSAYCTGEAGKAAMAEMEADMTARAKELEAQQREPMARKAPVVVTPEEYERKLRDALIAEEKRLRRGGDQRDAADFSLAQSSASNVKPVEFEAYRMKRILSADPMASYVREKRGHHTAAAASSSAGGISVVSSGSNSDAEESAGKPLGKLAPLE